MRHISPGGRLDLYGLSAEIARIVAAHGPAITLAMSTTFICSPDCVLTHRPTLVFRNEVDSRFAVYSGVRSWCRTSAEACHGLADDDSASGTCLRQMRASASAKKRPSVVVRNDASPNSSRPRRPSRGTSHAEGLRRVLRDGHRACRRSSSCADGPSGTGMPSHWRASQPAILAQTGTSDWLADLQALLGVLQARFRRRPSGSRSRPPPWRRHAQDACRAPEDDRLETFGLRHPAVFEHDLPVLDHLGADLVRDFSTLNPGVVLFSTMKPLT